MPATEITVQLVSSSSSCAVTRWLDGTLYIGASADHLYRVVTIDYDGPNQRALLTTAEQEQWLLVLRELAPRPLA